MKKIIYVLVFLFSFIADASATRHYERDFVGYDGSGYGYVSLDVTDRIVFTITVKSGSAFFCAQPESIVQGKNEYYIDKYCYTSDCIEIIWENFDGCGEIYEGTTATGIMSNFPSTFDVLNSFRLYCGIWNNNDYFDVEAYSPPTSSSIFTTTTTTAICLSEVIFGKCSEETEILRYLRDNVLSTTPEGKEIIKLYYELSPVIIEMIKEDVKYKEDMKEMIDGILLLIKEIVE